MSEEAHHGASCLRVYGQVKETDNFNMLLKIPCEYKEEATKLQSNQNLQSICEIEWIVKRLEGQLTEGLNNGHRERRTGLDGHKNKQCHQREKKLGVQIIQADVTGRKDGERGTNLEETQELK